MNIKIIRTNTVREGVEDSTALALIDAGLAVEHVREGAPKVVSEKCELKYTLGASSSDERISCLKYHCPVCGINGAGLGIDGAAQLAAKPPYHRGKQAPPPKELVQRAYGRAGSAFIASMATMRQGYAGSTRPWEWTDSDIDAAAQGKTAPDPTPTQKAVLLGDVNDIRA